MGCWVKIQTLVFIDTDRTITDDDDYVDTIVRGKTLHDILSVIGHHSEVGNFIQELKFTDEEYPIDEVSKGDDVIRTDYIYEFTYEERV